MKADLVRGAQILSVAVYDGTNLWLITPNDEVMTFFRETFFPPEFTEHGSRNWKDVDIHILRKLL